MIQYGKSNNNLYDWVKEVIRRVHAEIYKEQQDFSLLMDLCFMYKLIVLPEISNLLSKGKVKKGKHT